MRLHNVAYLWKEGTKSVFTNKLMSFACIGVLVACLLLIGSAILFTLNVNSIANMVEEQNEVVIIMEEGLSDGDIELLGLKLTTHENILSARFVSREEALEQEKLKFGKDAFLLDGIEADTYPNIYILRIDDLSIMEYTVSELEDLDGVEKVYASTEVARILVGVKQAVYIAGAAIVLILVAVSVVIITNTIKLSVFSRRKEINIMKYVGATDSFIRMPFLVEGMIIGLLAALLAFLIIGGGYTYLLQWAAENYGQSLGVFIGNAVSFESIALELLIGFTALGVFIGVAGSGAFVRRYLKV